MIERLLRELELVRARFGDIEVSPNIDWFVVQKWPLPPGWNKTLAQLLVVLPPGYPTCPPDNFYTDNDMRLANGALPGNTSGNQGVAGKTWLQFSYHVEPSDWIPQAAPEDGHNLLTFLAGVERRLSEVN